MDNILPAFTTNNIPVVFSSDDNYAPYLGVTIKSLIENSSPDNNYDIFVLDGGITENCKQKILSLAQNNISIRFIDINPFIEKYKNIFFTHAHFSISVYFRLFLSEIFTNYSKILYLDCDIIILNDIALLFNQNMDSNYYGAIKDYAILNSYFTNNIIHNYIDNTLQMQDINNYFNSGILLCNLDKIRENNLVDKFMTKLHQVKTPMLVDQDILNSVCENHITYLPLEWNFIWDLIQYFDTLNKIPHNILDVITSTSNKAKIIHYASGKKPWSNPERLYADKWWFYARMSPFYEEIIYKHIETSQKEQLKLTAQFINFKRIKRHYYKLYLLSKINFGKKRKYYKDKRKQLKEQIEHIKKSYPKVSIISACI